MNQKSKQLILLGLVLLLAAGCVNRFAVGPTETESRSIELGQAETAQVNVEMGIGELVLNQGSGNLLDAEFTYNVADWRPEVEYDISGGRGRLTVKQPSSNMNGIPDDNIRNEWELVLSEDVPIDLDIDLGVGDSQLDLNGLTLTELDVTTGVGKTTIDLSGDWTESFDLHITGGVGDTTIILPREAGVYVELTTGITDVDVFGLTRDGDNYHNDAYESAEVTLNLQVEGGIGQIELRQAE